MFRATDGIVGYCVGIAYDGFVSLVDAEGEAADASAVQRDEAGQDAGVEVLQQQFGGALVVPAQPLLPDARFGLEQGTELARGKVPEVEDLELGVDCHGFAKSLRRAYSNRSGAGTRFERQCHYYELLTGGRRPVDFEALRVIEE